MNVFKIKERAMMKYIKKVFEESCEWSQEHFYCDLQNPFYIGCSDL